MESCLKKVACIDFAESVSMQGIMQPPHQEAIKSSAAVFQSQTSNRYHQRSSFGSAGTHIIIIIVRVTNAASLTFKISSLICSVFVILMEVEDHCLGNLGNKLNTTDCF